ncbi:MarR family transcriptional regulator [Achromobacter mucicolens]|uniref:MarR family transcriptional regulator n=1 Tax=Achromobacter mucicolens TaxID=1389922 RepID=A0ABD4YUI1_9BURK|nr:MULTISPECIES: MarR family transcriptional regulator [Achromobacter]OXC89177.1 MarR family transcriptional regulator [Achromobacter sp. KAs 3-5]MCP2513671.1 MarR family transcriptional regulator [Achromobacter mucicolens]MDG9968563.1 MarR family transcriptional regulator [Achromobacter mucicolens]MDH1178916.1 MarR family transcriptional regulator [Achromobacter mucicolens]WBX90677.1 MarR family transcriptional regulator [Achromobacter mucicolens]
MLTPSDSQLMATTANLMVLSRAYRGAADKALADYGLSQATAWPVILAGRLGDGVRQGALAEALGVEGPSLVRVLDQLVAAGLMERREDPHDRRARTLHLTDAGHALRAQVEEVLVELRRRVFQGVSESDLQACLRVFDALKVSLGRSGAGAQEDARP